MPESDGRRFKTPMDAVQVLRRGLYALQHVELLPGRERYGNVFELVFEAHLQELARLLDSAATARDWQPLHLGDLPQR